MMFRTVFLGVLYGFIVLTSVSAADDWTLVWSDEFDKPGLPDPSKWGYEVGMLRNHELQYYTKERLENARVEDGHLVIEGRKEPYEQAQYTAASLRTKGKASWTSGRIAVRAKLPTGQGTWPAIWLLGEDQERRGWPACGEIDIMENVGFDPDVIHANIHTKRYNHVLKTNKGGKLTVPKPHADFHVYRLDWTQERMDFYVDDQKCFTYQNDGTGRDSWPFDQPHYLILNLAIGGDWGGREGVDDSIFPQKYYIDYVRVYQKAEAAAQPEEKTVEERAPVRL